MVVKKRYPKWNPKWKHGPKPAVFLWFSSEPYPGEGVRRTYNCHNSKTPKQSHDPELRFFFAIEDTFPIGGLTLPGVG